jgi:putative aldouronate transport system substrate-binding protein
MLGRRDFIRQAVCAITIGASLLEACAPAPVGTPQNRAGGARVPLPANVPLQGPQPDLPGTADGIDPGYIRFPSQLFKSVQETPLSGGQVNIMVWNITAPMTPLEQNAAWQEINRQVGGTINLSIVPFADYQTKLATTVAGDDLPDVIFIPPGTNVQGWADFLQAKCADLTSFLSGDGVKAYPNLANFRTNSWKTVLFNNGIYGVPAQYPVFLWVMWVHKELFDAVGAEWPKSADDFKRIMLQVTRPQDDVYGIVTETGTGFNVATGMFPAMFGAPNQWRVDAAGKLTRTIETEEYRAAVTFARDLYTAGVFTPTSNTNNNVASKAEFAARKAAVRWDGFVAAAVQYWDAAPMLTPPSSIRTVPPFAADGKSAPVYWLGPGAFGYSILKKTSQDRIREILRVLNFLAAPFGSQEYTLTHYGIEGVHYTRDANGNPILNTTGQHDVNILWNAIDGPPPILYYPKSAEFAPTMQGDERAMLPAGIVDPTIPLYSPTNGSKGGPLNQALIDGLSDIVAGRRPVSDFDQLVTNWRNNGGDQIRHEYEQALAASA